MPQKKQIDALAALHSLRSPVRLLNDHDYAERCAEGAAQTFPLQGSPLRSLSEVVGEREEWEVANAN
jgi:hypothetical protein